MNEPQRPCLPWRVRATSRSFSRSFLGCTSRRPETPRDACPNPHHHRQILFPLLAHLLPLWQAMRTLHLSCGMRCRKSGALCPWLGHARPKASRRSLLGRRRRPSCPAASHLRGRRAHGCDFSVHPPRGPTPAAVSPKRKSGCGTESSWTEIPTHSSPTTSRANYARIPRNSFSRSDSSLACSTRGVGTAGL